MTKNKMSAVVSNLKVNMFSSKISPDVVEKSSILIINNKFIKSVPILQFLLRVLTNSISISSLFSYYKMKNPDANNKSGKNKAEIIIKLEDEIN